MSDKIYIEVYTARNRDGMIVPLSFIWKDGYSYEVQRILSAEYTNSRRSVENSLKYTCYVNGRRWNLYHENMDMWYCRNNGEQTGSGA